MSLLSTHITITTPDVSETLKVLGFRYYMTGRWFWEPTTKKRYNYNPGVYVCKTFDHSFSVQHVDPDNGNRMTCKAFRNQEKLLRYVLGVLDKFKTNKGNGCIK